MKTDQYALTLAVLLSGFVGCGFSSPPAPPLPTKSDIIKSLQSLFRDNPSVEEIVRSAKIVHYDAEPLNVNNKAYASDWLFEVPDGVPPLKGTTLSADRFGSIEGMVNNRLKWRNKPAAVSTTNVVEHRSYTAVEQYGVYDVSGNGNRYLLIEKFGDK